MSIFDLDQEILGLMPFSNTTYLSTAELHEKFLRINSGPISTRTILRSLERLLDAGLVETEKRGVSFYWRKLAGATGFKLGTMMSLDEALALQTLNRFSSRQIPVLVAQSISGMFDVAQVRLEGSVDERGRRYRKWVDKVEVVGSGFTLITPRIDARIFEEVTKALFYERQLEVVYRARSSARHDGARVIFPLGLVEMDGLVYLIAGMKQHQNPAMYRVDRLSAAVVLDETFPYPRDFHLGEYVKTQRRFDFQVEGEIRLKLKFWNGAGDHLLETPFSEDQQAHRKKDWLEVEGTTLMSLKLRWWLRAFGTNVEVLKPARLRTEFAREARTLADRYLD